MYKIYADDYAQATTPHLDSDGCVELFWDHPQFPSQWSGHKSTWPCENWGELVPLGHYQFYPYDPYYILLDHFGLAEVIDELELDKVEKMSPEELRESKEAITVIRKASPLIFISYAREDQEQANQLYDSLYKFGFNVWLDKRKILPGEQWKFAIKQALHQADFILVCFSKKSVSKRGYLRREIVLALEKSLEMLDTDIFLITVRIEECDIPFSLSHFQWVDLFLKDGLENLVKAISEGMKRRGIE